MNLPAEARAILDKGISEGQASLPGEAEEIRDDEEIIEEEDDLEEEILDDEDEVKDDLEEGDVVLNGLSDLADHLGVGPEDLYNVEIPMADGEAPITISALKDEVRQARQQRFQLNQQQEELERGRRELETLRNNPATQFSEELLEAESVIRVIDAQLGSVDWNNIDDSGKAALYRQQLQDARNQAVQQRDALRQGMGNKQREAIRNKQIEDYNKTLQVIPEWTNKEVFTKDRTRMFELASKYGFTQEEFVNLTDPRSNQMMRDFVNLLEKTNNAEQGLKNTRKKGVVVRTKSRRRAKAQGNAATQSKVERAKRTGNKSDIMDAARSIYKGSRK